MLKRVVLNRDGCDRATAYPQGNKIVRAPGGLYLAWPDADCRCMLTRVGPDAGLPEQ